MKKTREEKINNAITSDGFVYKGVHYKPMSVRTLLLFEKYKSPFFYGGDQLRGLMDFLYISSHDPKQVAKIPLEQWDDTILDYADNFTADDLVTLGQMAEQSSENNAASIVEVRNDSQKKP